MKKFLVSLFLILVVVAASALINTSYGIGSPYGVTPTTIGDIYKDVRTGQLYKALSTTKGDWEKMTPVAADGSVSAPFTTMNFQPSDWPSVKAVGTVFLASSSLKLKMLTNVASNTWVDLN